MSLQIKPCIYCGKTTNDKDADTCVRAVEVCNCHASWWVSCNFCGANGPLCDSADDAVVKWNKPERK
jgi:hypothetical protein